ncbi:glycosyltransferase family 4 protein [Desulfovibrio ferrophilus]|uniref:Glycosyltransferase n=1 Tax=Desulfovibrio ferrophilus TaxID=241368 RepID=A0A2Z6B177_9BACT|nr:glycosyltransferase family 4 protein [Desulfovibrio ferrophilus]BBD09262.1 glycosyltransferase [Desulfovibrio ferrophilus]
MAPLKIAMVGLRAIGGDCSGGIETHVNELAPRVAALGAEVTVFCRAPYAGHLGKTCRGVNIEVGPCIKSKHLETVTHTGLSCLSMLSGYDVVHFHAIGPALFSWLPRLSGRGVVTTVHAMDYRRAKWGPVARAALKLGAGCAALFSHRLITVSRGLRDGFQQRYKIPVSYVPNGIARPESRPLEALRRFGIRPGYVLFLGRLVPEKGVHTLLEAFSRLKTDAQLVVAGAQSHTRGYADRLRRLARGDERIVFTGPLYREDKAEAYSNAGLFVLPSELEGMPITMLEAAAHACPVLTSDIPECLEPCQGGSEPAPRGVFSSFAVGDAGALAEAMQRMLADPDLPARGAAGRDFVLERYDWDRIARETLDVYRAVARRNEAGQHHQNTGDGDV